MSDDGLQKKQRRRRLRWLLFILVSLGVAAGLAFRDEALEPVDDLMPRRPAIPWDDNNGWKRLDDFALPLALPADAYKQRRRLSDLIKEEQDPLPAEARAFTLDEPQLAALEAIAAVPLFQSQPYEYPSDSGPPGWAALRDLQLRFHLTILSAMEENKGPLVLRLWKLSVALQRRMTAGATSGLIQSTANGFTDIPMVARSLVRLDWNDAELKELAHALTADEWSVDDARETAYHDFRRTYNYMLNISFVPDGYGGEESSLVTKLFYQKHRTANHYAKQTRVWRDALFVSTTEEIRKKQKECASSFPRWLDPNLHGTAILTGAYGPVICYKTDGRRAAWPSLRVLIALHRCMKARGSLPVRLDELVPEFLPAVPEDPYNHAPLHWNPIHRAVQNTGSEGVILPVSSTQTKLVSDDYRTFLFRTKAEEEAMPASAPPIPAKRRR
jgi:hypothetical protein